MAEGEPDRIAFLFIFSQITENKRKEINSAASKKERQVLEESGTFSEIDLMDLHKLPNQKGGPMALKRDLRWADRVNSRIWPNSAAPKMSLLQ